MKKSVGLEEEEEEQQQQQAEAGCVSLIPRVGNAAHEIFSAHVYIHTLYQPAVGCAAWCLTRTEMSGSATPTDLPIGNPDLEMLHAVTYTTQVGNTYTHIHAYTVHSRRRRNKQTYSVSTYIQFIQPSKYIHT